VAEHGGGIAWCDEVRTSVADSVAKQSARMAGLGLAVHVSIDADAVSMAEVPGVSAPNPVGLAGTEIIAAARLAGSSVEVAGLELVEINPRYDRDGQSARWGAVLVWNFLVGMLDRPPSDANRKGQV
jgi:formiminoglutamase